MIKIIACEGNKCEECGSDLTEGVEYCTIPGPVMNHVTGEVPRIRACTDCYEGFYSL